MAWMKPDEEVQQKTLYMREWFESEAGKKYREERKAKQADYRKKNAAAIAATKKEAYRKVRLEALRHYGGKDVPECRVCGENTFECLQFDHVENDGKPHRLKIGMKYNRPKVGGNGFPYWLKKNGWPNEPALQVLCRNCNIRKEMERRSRKAA